MTTLYAALPASLGLEPNISPASSHAVFQAQGNQHDPEDTDMFFVCALSAAFPLRYSYAALTPIPPLGH